MADYWDLEGEGESLDEGSEYESNAQRERDDDPSDKALTLAAVEALGAKGGRWGELWQELAEARRDRETRAARDALLIRAEALAEGDARPNFDDPAVRAAFRERERAKAEAAQAEVDRNRLEALIDGLGEELGRSTFEKERAEREAGGNWLMDGSDYLFNAPEFIAWETARAEERRALQFAADRSLPSLDEVTEAAAGGIARAYQLVMAKGAK